MSRVPAIRFKGFTDPWEQRKVGEIAEVVGGGTPNTGVESYWDGDIDWYSPAELGAQIYADYSVRKITKAGYDSCSATMLPANITILFTSRAGIGNTAILRRSACTNQGFQSLVVNDSADVYFVYSMTNKIKKFAEQQASGSTFLEISGKGLAAGEFTFPSKDEQIRIGTFFQKLDHLITLHQRKHDKLCTVKKSMLDKMFPKPGETFPEIRFEGFTDPWEQRKLGNFGEVAMCKRIYKDQTAENGDVPFFKIGTFGGEPDAFISEELFEDYRERFSFPKRGTLLVSAAGSIGRIVEYQGQKAYFQDSNIVWLEHGGNLDDGFLKQLYSKIKWGLEGSTIKRLYNKDILDAEVVIPEVTEQIQIGAFFLQLDHLITLHQRKLELLKNVKKSLLDKMFV